MEVIDSIPKLIDVELKSLKDDFLRGGLAGGGPGGRRGGLGLELIFQM